MTHSKPHPFFVLFCLSIMGLVYSCDDPEFDFDKEGFCKEQSTFEVKLDGHPWDGWARDCGSFIEEGKLDLRVYEITENGLVPDQLQFTAIHNTPGRKIYDTEDDVSGRGAVEFIVYEEADAPIDRYKIIPDGNSWLEVVSIDAEENIWVIEFDFTMLVTRENGPLNITYSDTLRWSDGRVVAYLRN